MKPCSKNRKPITWLVLDALDARQTEELRAHLGTCEGCRRYLEEIAAISNKLSAAYAGADIEVSGSFHQKWVRKLRAEELVTVWEAALAAVSALSPNWKVILPILGAAVAAIAALSVPARRPAALGSASTRRPAVAVARPNPAGEPAPTISNYQVVANQSLEELDDLLTRQGNRNPPPIPVYTVSTFTRLQGQE